MRSWALQINPELMCGWFKADRWFLHGYMVFTCSTWKKERKMTSEIFPCWWWRCSSSKVTPWRCFLHNFRPVNLILIPPSTPLSILVWVDTSQSFFSCLEVSDFLRLPVFAKSASESLLECTVLGCVCFCLLFPVHDELCCLSPAFLVNKLLLRNVLWKASNLGKICIVSWVCVCV